MDSASNPTPPAHHSSDSTAAAFAGGGGGGGVNSPKSRRSTASRGAEVPSDVTSAAVSPPLHYPAMAGGSSFLASGQDVVAEAQQESSENSGSGNAGGKKPAWIKPSSGGDAEVVSPVMGAATWPALSEITKASQKSSSSDSLKNLSEGSTSVSQETGIASSPSNRQVTSTDENPNSTPNHMGPTRQRSLRRGGGGNSSDSVSANGGFSQVPPREGLVVEVARNDTGKPGNTSAESSSSESTRREGGQRGGWSQSHGGSEHHQQRNSFRRGNSGPHPRGNGTHHHSYGGRRDQDRGNQDWNPHRNFGGRDAHMQPQRAPSRPFLRGPPHANTPYIAPPIPMRPPFGTPMIYPEVPAPVYYVPGPHPDPFSSVPVVAPMAPLFIPVTDPHLPMKILNQINYYFSDENLVKDIYLRRNMDEQGWVPIKLIQGFKKVSELTDNIPLILSTLQFSSIVEVEGEKVRRRHDWTKWIIPSMVQSSTVSRPPGSPQF